MGRKKKAETEGAEEEVVDGKAKFFEDFADVIFDASHIMGKKKKVVSVSPSFDLMTGGVPEGSFMALTGHEKVGKSVLALTVAAAAQKLEYANPELCPDGRFVLYLNSEHRIKDRDLAGIHGLDLSPERFKLIQSSPGNIINSQKFCTIAERAINEIPGCVVIIDSFTILSSKEEQEAAIGYQDRGKSNGIISQLMRKIAAPLCVNQCIVIGITHGMANTSGFGASWQEKSANALKFAEDIKLSSKKVDKWRVGTDTKSPQIGQKTQWNVEFAAVLAPGGTVNTHIRYGYGVDIYTELLEVALEYGLVDLNGSWYTMSFMNQGDNNPKAQGEEGVRNFLESNQDIYKDLRKQVYDIAGVPNL